MEEWNCGPLYDCSYMLQLWKRDLLAPLCLDNAGFISLLLTLETYIGEQGKEYGTCLFGLTWRVGFSSIHFSCIGYL